MRVFFATRRLCQRLQEQQEKELPLTDPKNSASEGDIVDLSKSHCQVPVLCLIVFVSFKIIVTLCPVLSQLGTSEYHRRTIPQ